MANTTELNIRGVFDRATGQLIAFSTGNATFGDGVDKVSAMTSLPKDAPTSLTSANASVYNGASIKLPAGATLTIDDSAWQYLTAGIIIQVGQSGTATLAFSGTAAKENASGTSASSVSLAACGMYTLVPSSSGTPLFRLSGGAPL